MDRRSAVRALLGTVAAVLTARELKAEVLPPVVVYRNPGCPCCEKWKQLMAAAGFQIIMKEDSNLAGRATSLGVPENYTGVTQAPLATTSSQATYRPMMSSAYFARSRV